MMVQMPTPPQGYSRLIVLLQGFKGVVWVMAGSLSPTVAGLAEGWASLPSASPY